MLNKKLLAAAIAASLSTSAFADIDLDVNTTSDAITVANESFSATDLNGDGNLVVTNNAGALDVTGTVDFTVAASTSAFVRYDLEGGVLTGAPTLSSTSAGVNFVANISSGGTAGDDFVIFEVSDPDGIVAADDLDFVMATVAANTGTAVTVQYRLFETGAGAVNELVSAQLANKTDTMIQFADSSAGEFLAASTVTALVAEDFMKYTGSALTAELSRLDRTKLINSGSFVKADGTAWVAADLITDVQSVTFSGDFSFGSFVSDTDNDCTTAGDQTAVTLNTEKTVATVAATNLKAGNLALCTILDGTDDVALKGSYSGTLVTDELTDDAGTIVYDTTTIEVPYITTFADYNQRFYLINNGSSPAFYTFTFTSEAGVTATAGTGATGTIPAKSVLMVKATDLVTLSGKTRTTGTIEVEGTDGAISASTQTVNLSDGSTDTVVLN